jgi:tryptophan synthase alpha chain
MPAEAGSIVVERLEGGGYRATCPLFPDLESRAPTEAAARQALAEALEQLLRERQSLHQPGAPATSRTDPSLALRAGEANPIDVLFRRLRSQGRKAFIPFLTAGDPHLEATTHLVRELVRRGASLVEVGFPYSDPIADGAVIQASYTRALSRGLHVDDIFAWARELAPGVPLVAMVSYSLVYRRGPEAFLGQAAAAGFSGAVVPDLPVEESEALAGLAAARDFKLIQLVTPTTPRERAVRIARLSTGFVYCVSVTGITGERDRLPPELHGQIAWLRGQTDLPICVGFGISRPEHVRLLRDVADGVIVGSALVRRLEQAASRPLAEVTREVGELAQSLAEALNPMADGRVQSAE